MNSMQLLEIFNGIDVKLVVADLHTDEILYANEKMNDAFGVDYNPLGKKCWDVYQIGKTGRCDHCPISKLEQNPDDVIFWEEYSEMTGRWFKNKSTMIKWTNGRSAHLKQSVDITNLKDTSKALTKRLEQQQLMNSIFQSFIANDVLLPVINDALRKVGEFISVDQILLVQIDEEKRTVDFPHKWFAPSVEPIPDQRLKDALAIEKITDAFVDAGFEYTISHDTHNDPSFKKGDIINMRAYLCVPIWIKGKLWGMLSLETSSQPKSWSDSDIHFAQMISNMISGILMREEMREKIAEADDRIETMLDSTPFACIFFDEDFNMIDCNEAAPRIFGVSSEQECIDKFFDLSPQFQPDGTPSKERAYKMLKQAFDTGREVFEYTHMHGDGTLMPMEITLVRVKWKDGFRIAGYCRDLRKLKAQMAEIERTHQKLKEARDRAQDSAKAKADFLANMSHEIRTPMNAIIGMTDLAMASDDIERIKYCLGRVDDAANHLLGVINDILDMSKIEAGKLELSPVEFPLERMLQRVTDIANFRAQQKQQDLIVKVDKDVPSSIIADDQRLAQVITNFLSNAVKFTPEYGKIKLCVHCLENKVDKCTLHFEVIDTGIGLTEEQKAKLFRSFAQADGSVSRRFGGTGLGLAISKNIVEMMDGHIDVDSKPQKGSSFHFTITVPKGNAEIINKLHSKVLQDDISLLVVDDAQEVREYFEDIAASIGVKCKTAADAYEACEILDTGERFSMMFIDWMMPGMNGVELTRKIHGEYDESVVVIMISVTEWENIRNDAAAAGVQGFLSKPLFPSRIVDCINENIDSTHKKHRHHAIRKRRFERLDGMRVLLVEDIEINREILIASLNGTGINIDVAEDGVQACDIFKSDPDKYDLILMDIHMPNMDGYEATKNIRTMNSTYALNVPILAMTANVFREDVERCLASGMDDHIGKPIDMEELVSKLKMYHPMKN